MHTVKRCVAASALLLRRKGWTLLILMLCQAAPAAEWRLSREVTITVAGGVAQVHEVCIQAPGFLQRIPESNTLYSCPGTGGPYFRANDQIHALLAGISEPDVEVTAHVRYTLTYIPTALEEPPRFVLVSVGCEQVAKTHWEFDATCCDQRPAADSSARAKATAFGDVIYEAIADVTAGCE